ncbi:hypothetical protein CONCODRAFT_82576 [Conidiobolus coronatus NRRL 28638]|uniref:RING-type domain-containing protein n=1 Tax=Conidiobolus coronatus (strain ATCC 28846 / CBS 209.66 / NRRL 28638) TaxID=796925 RepID=A0A137PJC9_CONC2|nr:hypothetical protein CONCODRAFT_82576 [Conidiobolus coronatus NRRL 28638]|eukprot:KXN75041.1 hypothetical protein CONCODRAFT_82576 [Conidiobolus coronatus NRRL 28638]
MTSPSSIKKSPQTSLNELSTSSSITDTHQLEGVETLQESKEADNQPISDLPLKAETLSDLGYCDSNVAMYLPSVTRVSLPPTVHSVVSSANEPHSTNQNEPSVEPLSQANQQPTPSSNPPVPYQPSANLQPINLQNNPNRLSRATNSGSRVRRNWLIHLLNNYRQASKNSRILLFLTTIYILLQVSGIVTILILNWQKACDQNLKILLILFGARLLVYFPITIYDYLFFSQHQINPNNYLKIFKTLIHFSTFLLFIAGNYMVINSSTCSQTAPSLFYFTLAEIIIGYLTITLPALICCAVVFCLPCFLVGLRMIRLGETVGSGASQDAINKLPLLQFNQEKSIVPDTNVKMDNSNHPQYNQLNPTKKSKPWYKKFFSSSRPKKESNTELGRLSLRSGLPILYILDGGDSSCAICLSDYEHKDTIRMMKCFHHYHMDCLDEWLKINRTCPLCKRDISGHIIDPSQSPEQFL